MREDTAGNDGPGPAELDGAVDDGLGGLVRVHAHLPRQAKGKVKLVSDTGHTKMREQSDTKCHITK